MYWRVAYVANWRDGRSSEVSAAAGCRQGYTWREGAEDVPRLPGRVSLCCVCVFVFVRMFVVCVCLCVCVCVCVCEPHCHVQWVYLQNY